jgi:DNA-binding transcriptional ArsR family regulator
VSITAISWALGIKTGSPSAKLVLIKLADNANDAGRCWPSLRHICEHTELSERAVRTHIRALEELGLVSVEKRSSEGVSLPNVYTLNLHQTVGVGHLLPHPPASGAPRVGHSLPPNLHSKPSIEPSKEEECSETVNRSEPTPDDPVICFLPTNEKTEFPIFQSHLVQFRELYPAVNVDQSLRGMRGWLLANPKKRKTRVGMMRFVNSWLSREQDKGHLDIPSEKSTLIERIMKINGVGNGNGASLPNNPEPDDGALRPAAHHERH